MTPSRSVYGPSGLVLQPAANLKAVCAVIPSTGTASREIVLLRLALSSTASLSYAPPAFNHAEDRLGQHDVAAWNVDAVERLAYYECPACRHHIEQSWRHTMIRGGQWKATNPNAPVDRVSFHLNALYSPWRTWGSIAREFLEVKDSPSGLQNFTNSVLADPWRIHAGEQIQEAGLLDLRADYPLGTCPVKPRFITIAADVQRACIFYTVRAWGEGAES